MPTHLYQICHSARRMDRNSEAELWARFKAVRPQDACAVTPARPAQHPMPEQSTQRANGRANTCLHGRQ